MSVENTIFLKENRRITLCSEMDNTNSATETGNDGLCGASVLMTIPFEDVAVESIRRSIELCSVCQEEFDKSAGASDQPPVKPLCSNHYFHKACVVQ